MEDESLVVPRKAAWLRQFDEACRLYGFAPVALQVSLSVATALVIVELIIAQIWQVPKLPIILCAIAALFSICWCLSRRVRLPTGTGLGITLAMLLKTLCLFVAVTGGVTSPYTGLLYLPIFFSAVYFGFLGGMCVGTTVCFFLWQITLWRTSVEAAPVSSAFTQCTVFATVTLTASLFTERMRRTAFSANRKALAQQERADQFEWFTDTVAMMQALTDLDSVLSVALMRVEYLVPCTSAAIYMRHVDDPQLSLVQVLGLVMENVALQTISSSRQEPLRDRDFEALFVPDTTRAADPLYSLFAPVNPRARSVLVVPLRSFDDLFGVLYVASNRPGGFTTRDRSSLIQFAQQIVSPIQRVRLQSMASTDVLTGLYNRRAFRQRLEDEVDRAGRYGHVLSLVMIDIDHFKTINDSLGHRAGDAILSQIGAILLRGCRGIDFVARYGGEEMVVLCPESHASDTEKLAERIRRTVADAQFQLPEGGSTNITISAGVAMLGPGVVTDASLVEAADQALYKAKAGGRNRVVVE